MSEGTSRIPKVVWITTPTIAVLFFAFIYYLSTLPAGDELAAVKGDAKKALQQGMAEAEQVVTDNVINELAGDAIKSEVLKDKVKQLVKNKVDKEKTNYEFYKLLEQQEVDVDEVDEYRSTPRDEKPQHQYILQAASFRSQSEADSLHAQLLFSDLPATIELAQVKGSTWHRVYVGPFTDRSKLNKAQDQLVAKNINAIVIKRPLVKK